MDSWARGAFLSGGGFLVSLDWPQAARVSNSAVATRRIRADRRGGYRASMCIGCLSVQRCAGRSQSPWLRELVVAAYSLASSRSLPDKTKHTAATHPLNIDTDKSRRPYATARVGTAAYLYSRERLKHNPYEVNAVPRQP